MSEVIGDEYQSLCFSHNADFENILEYVFIAVVIFLTMCTIFNEKSSFIMYVHILYLMMVAPVETSRLEIAKH